MVGSFPILPGSTHTTRGRFLNYFREPRRATPRRRGESRRCDVRTILMLALMTLPAAAQDEKCGTCGSRQYGTTVEWAGTPSEAAAIAKEKEKLVFVLHVSGYFEDPKFT
jgi:hypothetical protein